MRHGDAAQVEFVGFFAGGTPSGLFASANAESGDESLADAGGDLVVHGEHVRRGDGHGITPERTVVLHVHRFQSDLELVAFLEEMPGNDVGNVRFEADLLEVYAGSGVPAGGGERADGNGRNVGESGGDFVGKGHAKEINVGIGAKILQGKNGDRFRCGGGGRS